VWVAYNTNHVLEQAAGYFNLTPHLTANFAAHWEGAKAMGTRAVSRVNAVAGVPNGD
jgi:hypothetical protein